MALPPLASVSDLLDRGVALDDTHQTMLAVASSVVRRAAGRVPISETDSTIQVTAWGEHQLTLPGRPIQSVTTVKVDGATVTDWTLTDTGHLWRRSGWGCAHEPATIEVSLTHGYSPGNVPDRLVQLVCDLTIAGGKAAASGGVDPRVVAESVDDYTVRFASGADAVASAMELPRLTRAWLSREFGGGAHVVSSR